MAMKGYEMVLIVNGILFLVLGLLTLLNSFLLGEQGERCPQGNITQCERESLIASTARLVAPYLFAGGILLLGTGLILVHRRRQRPSQPVQDEGPEYL